ncbi:hypothetical protein Mapa_009555 [Marchantia paleacea]|nr:hypothetical protein Mapa_009555 [Marchantia paleacea]
MGVLPSRFLKVLHRNNMYTYELRFFPLMSACLESSPMLHTKPSNFRTLRYQPQIHPRYTNLSSCEHSFAQ